MVFLYILCGIVGIYGLTYTLNLIQDHNRKLKCKTWEAGDKLILKRNNEYYRELEKNNKEYAILVGWSLDSLYIDCGGNFINKTSWSVMEDNKSDNWRRYYKEAQNVMGKPPLFNYVVSESTKSTNNEYHGKIIETMNEIECDVYLNQALDEKNHNIAELIRKRMERFR